MLARMKRFLAATAIALASCAPPPPAGQSQGPAAELAGRIAGAPEHCVATSSMNSLRLAEGNGHLLLYGAGRTIYANSLGQCSMRADDVLVTQPVGPNYCRGDLVRSFDRQSHIPGPACALGDFVPYNRP
jgi:hypothetical protein